MRARAEVVGQHRGHGVRRQRRRLVALHRREEAVEVGRRVRLAGADTDDDGEPAVGRHLDQRGHQAARRVVRPLEVVDHDHGRAALGEVAAQPHEAAPQRRLFEFLVARERRPRAAGCCRLVPGRWRQRHELPHDPQRVVALEHAGPRPEHRHPALPCEGRRLGQERRLADTGRPRERERPARRTAGPELVEQRGDRSALGGALEERAHRSSASRISTRESTSSLR